MAKFYGVVGYGIPTEVSAGVWDDVIVERSYFGDVVRNSRGLSTGDKINNDLTVGNSISIVADAYANNHFFAIRYVEWAGTLWLVSNIDVEAPRLILRLGGVYNGPRAEQP